MSSMFGSLHREDSLPYTARDYDTISIELMSGKKLLFVKESE